MLQTQWPQELLAHPSAAIALQKDMQVIKDVDKANMSASPSKARKTARKSKRQDRLEKEEKKRQNASGSKSASRMMGKKGSDEGLRRVFGGLRVKMALDFGYCDHSVHEVSGRYTYSGGPITNSKAILATIQSGGQIVASSRIRENLKGFESSLRDNCLIDLGTHVVPSCELPQPLVQYLPIALKDRELLPLKTVRKISPAYTDAPDAMVPEGVPLPPVTLAFTYVVPLTQARLLHTLLPPRTPRCAGTSRTRPSSSRCARP
jgi:hypothetical protein